MRIRTKLLALVLLVAGGFLVDTYLSIRTYEEIVSIREAIDRGVRLIAQARKAHNLMTDMVFDLFSPRLYSSLQDVILAPSGRVTQRQWTAAVAEFRSAYTAFMADPVIRALPGDEELRSSYKTADTLAIRADKEFDVLEADFTYIRAHYNGTEELYNRLQLSKDESLYAVFDHMRSASFYLGNIFESYLERFVSSLEQSAQQAQSRALFSYVALCALVTAFAVAGILLVTRSILSNVRLVDGAIERMSEGDFSSRVDPLGHDELGQLAERVNVFSQRLKANVDSLSSLLGSVNNAIPGDPDLDEILEIVTASLLRYEGVDCSAVCLIEDGSFARVSWAGFPPVLSWDLLAVACGADGDGRLGSLRSFLIKDAQAEPDAAEGGGLDPCLRSAVASPLVARHRLVGLCVFGSADRAFNDLELTQLESFADYAALVIDNAIVNAALRARSDAEYQALQAQMQPHFMYNVLNGFVALNRMGDRGILESSLHALRDMMRYTLEHAPHATVREEFAFLEQYCRLQKLRFDDRFDYAFDMDSGASELAIPKLLVQPLLENAFIHGIEPSLARCLVRVSARVTDGELVLEVSDDGVGCDPASIEERERVGIGNVRERLALLYPRATFLLSGAVGSGFGVKIAIPVDELETRQAASARALGATA